MSVTSQLEQFQRAVDETIGPLLDRIGAVFERREQPSTYESRIYYRSSTRHICLYDARRDGEVNCLVGDLGTPEAEWITVWEATGYGAGMTFEELVALRPCDEFLSNEEMLEELGDRLLMLSW